VIETIGAQEYAQACGRFFDAVNDRELRHLGRRTGAGNEGC
jgi:hypothetical protein